MSFTRGVERVGIAQAPFSQKIGPLEQEMGVRLLGTEPRACGLDRGTVTVFAERAASFFPASGRAVVGPPTDWKGSVRPHRWWLNGVWLLSPRGDRTLLEFHQAYPSLHVTFQREQVDQSRGHDLRESRSKAAFIRSAFEADEGVVA